MSKLATAGITAAAVLALLGGGYWFARKIDLIHIYPEAVYLDENEAEKRPFYGEFNDTEKAAYTAILHGIEQHDEEIDLPSDISGTTYEKLYGTLEKQEFDKFYISSSLYSAEKLNSATVIYRPSEKSIDEMNDELNAVKAEVRKGMADDMDEYSKAKYIHDYIIKNCEYVDNESEFSSTVYGCLVEKKTNCEGYAKTFGILASDCGLDVILLTGQSDEGENHAWNQVRIDGKWYNVDVTWDDAGVADIRWMYFLCDDEYFGKNHILEKRYFKPFECNSTENNYYIRENLYAETKEEAKEIFMKRYKAGDRYINIKFKDSYVYSDFKWEYIDSGTVYRDLFDLDDSATKKVVLTLTENVEQYCMTIEAN